jgi:hypothetical protein
MKTIFALIILISSQAIACNFDTECGHNGRCQKTGNGGLFQDDGYCVQMQQANPYGGQQPTYVSQKTCKSVYDCTYGQRCVKDTEALWGVCQ